jgi:hypothetical protein
LYGSIFRHRKPLVYRINQSETKGIAYEQNLPEPWFEAATEPAAFPFFQTLRKDVTVCRMFVDLPHSDMVFAPKRNGSSMSKWLDRVTYCIPIIEKYARGSIQGLNNSY